MIFTKSKFDFLEVDPYIYNNFDNCGFQRPYILDFSPIIKTYSPDNFEDLIEKNSKNTVEAPYTLLIQVALGYLDGGFSLISNGLGQKQYEKFVRHIFKSVEVKNNSAYFLHIHPKPEYGLDSGWSSAMTQGQALSLWVRLRTLSFFFFGDLDYIGPLLLNGMLTKIENGGGLYHDPRNDEFWLEEYPSFPVSHVLNGYIFALFGLIEFNRCGDFNSSKSARDAEIRLIGTLSKNIYRYDRFGWSSYDLAKGNFSPTLYHMIHIYTLNYLSIMLNNSTFFDLSQKWRLGTRYNNYHIIDILRFIKAAARKVIVNIARRSW